MILRVFQVRAGGFMTRKIIFLTRKRLSLIKEMDSQTEKRVS
jgi:hypothetical protein